MQKGLQKLLELSGVETCVVIDNHGSTFHKVGSMRFSGEELDEIGALIIRALASLENNSAEIDELEFFFDHYQILARDLGQAVLYVISQPSANMSLLRMTTNVVLNRWKEAPDVKKTLKKHALSRLEGQNLFPKPEITQSE